MGIKYKNWLEIENRHKVGAIKNGNTTSEKDLYIYGDITDEKWFDTDITPSDLLDIEKEINEASALNIYIDSPGGGVFAGMTIFNILKRSKTFKRTIVDGKANSIASVIALVGDEKIINENSVFTIHNPFMVAYGDSGQLRKDAEVLDKIKENIIGVYKSIVDKSEKEFSVLMDKETMFTGVEAFEFGFFDKLIKNNKEEIKKEIKNSVDKCKEDEKDINYSVYENSIKYAESLI